MKRFMIYSAGCFTHLCVWANRPQWAMKKALLLFPRFMLLPGPLQFVEMEEASNA